VSPCYAARGDGRGRLVAVSECALISFNPQQSKGEIMTNLLKLAGLTIALGGVGVAAPRTALAGSHRFSGNICNPDASAADAMSYGPWGVWNTNADGQPKAVTCGINLANAPTVTDVKVVVHDRHLGDNHQASNPPAVIRDNVSCEIFLLRENDGSIITSGYAQTPWGDNSTNGAYWSAWTLIYDPANTVTKSIVVRCLIPDLGVNGGSYVTAIEVNTL
jgi:hypothetical protein